jgi:NitT/TauT family transport system permease protein
VSAVPVAPPPSVIDATAPQQPASRMRRAVSRGVGPFAVLCLFIAGWALISSTVYAGRNYLVPTPWQAVRAAVDNAALLADATRITLVESVLGFAIAIVLGMGVATLMSQAKWLERSLYPYAIMLQTVPIVAVAPIIVLWFKYGTTSVVIVSVMIAVFPILNNTLLGLLSVDRNHLDLFTLHRAGRLRRFVKLQLPGAMPSIIAGLKISAGLSVVGAIVGEFIIGSGGSQGGLGVKVIFTQAQLNTPLLFAEVAAATLLGVAFFLVVSYVGHLFLHTWHESALRTDA